VGRETLKSDIIFFAEEEAMLASDAASPDTPSGLNCRYFFNLLFFHFHLFMIP
jgi:hypothetical protein